MDKHRGMQRLIDSATRLVIAFNKLVLPDYDAPIVELTIYRGNTMIYVDDGIHRYIYGGPKPALDRTLKHGLAHVKRLLHDYQDKEAQNNADKARN